MKTHVALEPERIRHYRKHLQLTQQGLASRLAKHSGASHESLSRMVQKWEQTGKVSPQHARHLAKALEVTVEDLQDPAGDLAGGWWIRQYPSPPALVGQVLPSVAVVTDAVREIVSGWRLGIAGELATVEFESDKRCSRISTKDFGFDRSVELRRVRTGSPLGLTWATAEAFERETLEASIRDVLFDYAALVIINGKHFPPNLLFLGDSEFLVEHLEPRTEVALSQELFPTFGDFTTFFHQWIAKEPTYCLGIGEEIVKHGLYIDLSNEEPEPPRAAVRITRVSTIGNGEAVHCPWPLSHRTALVKQMSAWFEERESAKQWADLESPPSASTAAL